MQQLNIVSIFLVWIWANISLQKSIPECLHSSSGLEACKHLSAFENDGSREKALLQMRSPYTWWSIPRVSPRFYFTTHPPSLSFLNWSLWRSLACERAIFFIRFATLLTELGTHARTYRRKMQANNARLVSCNLTVCRSEPLCLS